MIQFVFITTLVMMLVFYGLIIFAANRAHRQTKIPVPVVWQRIIAGALIFILASIVFIASVSP